MKIKNTHAYVPIKTVPDLLISFMFPVSMILSMKDTVMLISNLFEHIVKLTYFLWCWNVKIFRRKLCLSQTVAMKVICWWHRSNMMETISWSVQEKILDRAVWSKDIHFQEMVLLIKQLPIIIRKHKTKGQKLIQSFIKGSLQEIHPIL